MVGWGYFRVQLNDWPLLLRSGQTYLTMFQTRFRIGRMVPYPAVQYRPLRPEVRTFVAGVGDSGKVGLIEATEHGTYPFSHGWLYFV
jgi:hypothetical protein